ncbi:MAG: hypothetical protein J4215_03585 [Candidatus Diapherotrites archaeon]|uniref:Uncharacterized protein n=1 Tax=Candidatus Iainarchaeum sp. TaxID=3101447 RepID=A0A8T4L7Z4_9ARCH|nr:hypothetical protein [Candidatus Diapherotrites archaeon]
MNRILPLLTVFPKTSGGETNSGSDPIVSPADGIDWVFVAGSLAVGLLGLILFLRWMNRGYPKSAV